MASINLSGVLRDPLGEVSYGNKVRFTHLTTTGETLKGFRSQKTIVVNGAYDIDLEYGNVVIETFDNLNRRWIGYDPITINSDTPASSLPALLGITTPATDADLLVFQALAADASQSASNAESAKVAAQLAQSEVESIVDELITSPAKSSYGIEWDSTNDIMTRKGSLDYSYIQRKMKRCVLNDDGSVNYYLNPTDSTLKDDGTTANLDGTDGNVMVQIPKFYVKFTTVSSLKTAEISPIAKSGFVVHPAFIKAGVEVDYRYYRAYKGYSNGTKLQSISGVKPTREKTIAEFRTLAVANGAGWHQLDWHLSNAVNLLYLIEYASFNSQAELGNGNSIGNNFATTTGISNKYGNSSTSAPNDDFVSYRGIEHFFAEAWEFVDGVNVSERVVFVNSNYETFESDVFTGDYETTGVRLPTANASYIRNFDFSVKGLIPTSASGASSNTFGCDGLWSNTGNRIVLRGGFAAHGALCGAFYAYASYDSGILSSGLGAGVSF